MNGKVIIIRINLSSSAIGMFTRISWEEGINGKGIINGINMDGSPIEKLTRI